MRAAPSFEQRSPQHPSAGKGSLRSQGAAMQIVTVCITLPSCRMVRGSLVVEMQTWQGSMQLHAKYLKICQKKDKPQVSRLHMLKV